MSMILEEIFQVQNAFSLMDGIIPQFAKKQKQNNNKKHTKK